MSNSEHRCTGAAYHYSTLARVLNHASQLLPTRVCSAIATLCAHLQLPEFKRSMQVGGTKLKLLVALSLTRVTGGHASLQSAMVQA